MDIELIKSQVQSLLKERDAVSHKLIEIEGAIKALNKLLNAHGASFSITEELNGSKESGVYVSNPSMLIGDPEKLQEENKDEKAGKNKYVFDDGYHVNMSNRNKVKFVIKDHDKFVHNRQIAEELHRREPQISEDEWAKKISAALSSLRQKGQLVNFSVNGYNRNTFWGSPKWLDSNKEIKKEYMYDKEYLQEDSVTIEI